MCGIAGIFDWSGRDNSDTVKRMLDSFRYRGPDGEGIVFADECTLGHRRLAIIDLTENGAQPMCSPSGRIITFNGEIYNYRKLRKQLSDKGYSFQTDSDTEVILAGLDCWGIKKLCQQLEGMFAFAVWNPSSKCLTLARDRFGEKPLYYSQTVNGAVFSSQAKPILQTGLVPGGLSALGIQGLLHLGYTCQFFPFFSCIKTLPPASFAEITQAEHRVFEYWKMPVESIDESLVTNSAEAIRRTKNVLEKVVRKHLVADVPVACLLSGGVDSALIASYASEAKSSVELYTVQMEQSDLDESSIAKKIAGALGARHHIIPAVAPQLDDFIALNASLGEPLGDASLIPMSMVAAACSKQVKVVLTGDGGDEMFAGYQSVNHNLAAERARKWAEQFGVVWLSKLIQPLAGWLSRIPFFRKVETLSRAVNLPISQRHTCRSYVPVGSRIYGPKLLESTRKELFDRLLQVWESSRAVGEIDRQLHYDSRTALPGDYLKKVDTASMFHSLEARTPFLDVEIANLAATLSVETKRLGGESKGILKKILMDRIGSPAQQSVSGKRGFVLPIDSWLDTTWRDRVWSVCDSRLVAEGYLDRLGVQKAIQYAEAGDARYQRLRYTLFSLSCWYEDL